MAGLEPGGSHARLFRHLSLHTAGNDILDPGCVVDLADGSPPIHLWHDPERWRRERQQHFPGSERFWAVCSTLHRSNWAFAARDPVLPPAVSGISVNFLAALRPATLASGVFTGMTIADLLVLCGCGTDRRLRQFLDLQLKLYSQEPADRTAVLYGATVLQMAQAPLGLFHLQGSMQVLSRYWRKRSRVTAASCCAAIASPVCSSRTKAGGVISAVQRTELSGWRQRT